MNKTFKKIIVSVLLSLFVLPIFTSSVFAQSELFFGQNHFYSVVFRGNGEAVVYAKIVIKNPDDRLLTEFSFEIPKVSPAEMVIYQIELPRECINYDYNDPKRPCVKWRDPDYTQSYYREGLAEYQRIQYTETGDFYNLTLSTPIEPYKSGAIIIAYTTKGYVKESFGLFKFNFETIKVSSRIEEVMVAASVDTDLFFKGKQAEVDYMTDTSDIAIAPSLSVSSRDLDKTVRKIGFSGQLIKTAKNLAPNETFIVRGEYAKSWFRLHLKSMFLTLLIIGTIFAGIYFLTRFSRRRYEQNKQLENNNNQETHSQKPKGSASVFNLTNTSMGLLSVLLVIGLTYFIEWLLNSDFLYKIDISPNFMIQAVVMIVVILLYFLAIFGLAIIIAIKHGWKSFVSIIVAEILWFVVLLIIYLSFFS